MTDIDAVVALARRFTINWLDLADAAVPATIMAPNYQVHIGTAELDGLEQYVAGTVGQLRQFPGLTLTVHELVTDGDRLALVFTEHAASVRHEGRAAAWRGVALFRCAGGVLVENWTQEDYLARRRQLATGRPDAVPAPALAPWTTAAQPADPGTEAVARAWLGAPDLADVALDDGSAPTVVVEAFTPAYAFCAGDAYAFAGSWSGHYAGGVDEFPADPDRRVEIGVCGVVHVEHDRVVSGHVVTDRLGLRRSLLEAAGR